MANVSNAKQQIIKVTLRDGVERKLVFTLNALAELEEKFGSVEKAFDKLEKENSMVALRAILWAGFLYDDPNITEREVGNLIDLAFMETLTNAVSTALETGMPEQKQDVSLSIVNDPNA